MTTQTLLLVGGAVYMGAHVADESSSSYKDVVINDSFYQGLESPIEYLCKKFKKVIPVILVNQRIEGTEWPT